MLNLEQLYGLIDKEVEYLKWPKEPSRLYDPLAYMMDMGGKRIRPRLCLLSYNLFSDNIGPHILAPSVAFEVFHNFTLIHDDIMDKADIRRGRPTVYRKWDNNTAILSGDTMCLCAFRMLGQAPKECLYKVLDVFTKTTIEVSEGQQLDMDFETRGDVSLDEYMNMIGLKTSVLIAGAAAIGSIIAGADEAVSRGLYDFGYKLGLAFQIQDDYLDSFGDEKVFGKKIGGDILNNKKTWLLIKCQEEAGKKDLLCGNKENVSRLQSLLEMSEKQGDTKITAVKEFYRALHIDTLAKEAIDSCYSEALQSVKLMDLEPEQKKRLEEFASSLVSRNK